MSLSVSARQRAEITGRLRAAGCVFAEDEAALLISAASTPAELAVMVGRRAEGLPLEHVIGWAEFCGLRITVAPGVFVPRRRSEFLVSQAIAAARRPAAIVLDLCCGSGAIGIAVAAGLNAAELHAVDIEPAAAACARANVALAGAGLTGAGLAGAGLGGGVYQGDLYQPLPARLRGAIDVIVANAPYVPSGQIGLLPAEARLHEPLVTLDGGADGVGIQRRIAALAPDWLGPGRLLIETSDRQVPLTAAAIAAAGLVPQVLTADELDATVVIGSRPGVSGAG